MGVKGLGAFIVLAIILLQGVAAIVAGIKKQKARSIAEAKGVSAAPSAPKEPSITPSAAKRQELIERRRQQIEELRARAQKKASAGRAPKAPPKAPVPVPAPVAMPAVGAVETPRVEVPAEPHFAHQKLPYARKRRGHVHKVGRLLRSRESLRNAFILKELIDPPIALRSNGRDLH